MGERPSAPAVFLKPCTIFNKTFRISERSVPIRRGWRRGSMSGQPWGIEQIARSSRPRARVRFAPCALLLATAAGCSTVVSNIGTTQDAVYAASPTNIASLTDVVQHNPNDPQAYNMRGSVLGEGGRTQEALADFNKAISLDPNFAQAYANRALIYRQTGKLDLAAADYNKALSIDANYAPAYLGRGVVNRQKGQFILALQDFYKAIQLRPDNAQAYYNRGLLYQSQRQHQFAIDDFSTAIALAHQQAEPQNLQAWASRGLAYERLNDKEKAAGSYARALNINKDYKPARDGFARVGG